jgi:hypothetical protein
MRTLNVTSTLDSHTQCDEHTQCAQTVQIHILHMLPGSAYLPGTTMQRLAYDNGHHIHAPPPTPTPPDSPAPQLSLNTPSLQNQVTRCCPQQQALQQHSNAPDPVAMSSRDTATTSCHRSRCRMRDTRFMPHVACFSCRRPASVRLENERKCCCRDTARRCQLREVACDSAEVQLHAPTACAWHHSAP